MMAAEDILMRLQERERQLAEELPLIRSTIERLAEQRAAVTRARELGIPVEGIRLMELATQELEHTMIATATPSQPNSRKSAQIAPLAKRIIRDVFSAGNGVSLPTTLEDALQHIYGDAWKMRSVGVAEFQHTFQQDVGHPKSQLKKMLANAVGILKDMRERGGPTAEDQVLARELYQNIAASDSKRWQQIISTLQTWGGKGGITSRQIHQPSREKLVLSGGFIFIDFIWISGILVFICQKSQ